MTKRHIFSRRLSYNFRLMHRNEMKRAVAACAEAGIGLNAMKTQGADR